MPPNNSNRGLKLHLIAARRIGSLPLPAKIHFSEASRLDLAALGELAPRLPEGAALFADKAYFHQETEEDFKKQGWFLLVSYKPTVLKPKLQSRPFIIVLSRRFVSRLRVYLIG